MNLIDTDCLPETLDFNAAFEAGNQLDRSAALDAATIAALRTNRLGSNEPAVRLPQGHDRTVAGVPVREFRPPEYDGVYLHIHGGGWAFGSAASQDEELWRLATSARLAVLSIEYRLAPEYRLIGRPQPAGSGVTRTDRLYALVGELRAAAPRARTVAGLAERLEVSERTVQRDLQALMAGGVPVRYATGRGGGWSIDPAMTLPPIRFTPEEAAALTVALAAAGETPYAGAARSALQKVAASMTAAAETAARDVAARIVALPPRTDPAIRQAVERGLAERRVLRVRYVDADGRPSLRDVEPAGLLSAAGQWYLVAWCRTRRAGRASASTASRRPLRSTSTSSRGTSPPCSARSPPKRPCPPPWTA